MQLSFPLHNEFRAQKGSRVLVYRRGALQRQVRVVAVVMGVIFHFSLTPPPKPSD